MKESDASGMSTRGRKRKIKHEDKDESLQSVVISSFPAAAPLNFNKMGGRGSGDSTKSKAKKKNTRDESSLKALTKRFVTLIGDASNGILDLNEAAKLLAVQKRRIYDITNVLEGIELIEKKGKNNIKWRGSGIAVTSSNSEESQEISQIKSELEMLQKKNDQLDQEIAEAQRRTLLPEDKRPAFVCYDDIINIPTLQDRTIIAVRAPPGTMLTVPDPDDGLQYPDRRYQIFLKSKEEPIQVFLLKEGQQQQQPGALTPAAPASAQRHRSLSPYPSTPPPQAAHPRFPLQSPPPLDRHSVAPQNLLSPTQDFRAIRQLSPPREEPAYYYSNSNYGISDLFFN